MNAKNREEKREEQVQEVVEEKTPVQEEPKEEATKEETPVEETAGDADRRRKKRGLEVEVKKEDLLIRPENALNYAEYVQQLKEKNQSINIAPKKTVEVIDSDLKPQVKDSNLTIGISDGTKKQHQKQKPKEKKDEKLVDVNFQTGDDNERRYDNRENNRNYGKKKNQKFQFKAEDYPELK